MIIGKTHAEAQIVLIDHELATVNLLSMTLASAGYLPAEGIVNPRRGARVSGEGAARSRCA